MLYPYSGKTLCENPYDLMAEIIANLSKKNPDLFQDPSRRRTTANNPAWEQAVDKLFREYPQLEDRQSIYMRGLDHAAAEAVRDWTGKQDFFPLLALAQRLDRVIPWDDQLQLSYTRRNGERCFSSLNTNERESGVSLFPRVPSIYDNHPLPGEAAGPERKWQSRFDPGVNQELKNVYYTLREEMVLRGRPCTVIHHIVDAPPVRRKLRIAVSPLLRDAELKADFYSRKSGGETENRFSVQNIGNWERVSARIQAAYLESCRQQVDILILPEMLGRLFSPGKSCNALLERLSQAAENQGLPAPYLTVGPTVWHENHNVLYIMDSTGGLVCAQEKQFPFVLPRDGKNYLEDILPGPPVLHVIHSPWLGRLGFAVCADFLQTEMTDLLIRKLHCNFLIVPSYSPGKTQMDHICGVGKGHGVNTVWVNCCSAGEKMPEFVGVVASPEQQIRFVPRCGGRCGGDHRPCLFIAELDLRTGEIREEGHVCPGAGM